MRLSGLDGLRGLAALSVLGYHVMLSCGLTDAGPLAPALAELKAGVTIFFVISGCVLWLPYARALLVGDPLPSVRRYVDRRCRRILPAYWVALTVVALLPWNSVFGPGAWRFYGLAQLYRPATLLGGLGPAWSLCVEASFYACLPLLALVARRCGRGLGVRAQLTALAAVGVGSLVWRALLTGSPLAEVPHRGFVVMAALPGCADWFALGMAIAVLVAARQGRLPWPRGASWLLARPSLSWLIVGGLLVVAALGEARDMFLGLWGPVPHVAAGLAAALVVGQLALAPGGEREPPLRRALCTRPLRWLGDVSYGIFLWNVIVVEVLLHGPVIAPRHAGAWSAAIARLAVASLGTLACAAASWYAIERPLLRARATRQAAPAPSAA